MNKPILAAILVLILATLACGEYITPTPASIAPTDTGWPSSSPVPSLTPTTTPEMVTTSAPATVIQAVVNVRQEPGGVVVGSLQAGDVVTVLECVENWCKIEQPFGYVWRGCLSDNPAGLGCEAR